MAVVTISTEPIDFTVEVIYAGGLSEWIDVQATDKREAFSIVRRQLGFGNGRIGRLRKGVQGVKSEQGVADMRAYHARIARPLI